MSKYPFHQIEKKWQQHWEEHKTFRAKEDPSVPRERRAYVLDMFPYPSGSGLHVGHPEGYTATDIYCRYLRMKGYNVLHPMGFDSFGLPAENYAITTGTHPRITTEQNIEKFRSQIKGLGFSYDWDREVSTHTPEYYRWTQWIFLQLFKRGLAYESDTPINWCPDCLTGLANEEVIDGACDRCGTQVRRKTIRQWILKITEYADRLLEDLEKLDWSDAIKAMQRNWIGRSEGANVRFSVERSEETLSVYTTRPDTLFGATYMVLAPEHPLVKKITSDEQREAVEAYLEKAEKKSDLERTDLAKEKTGVFSGAYAVNPVNGKSIPIWIADYVLISYGSGAIMAVPGHDQRDWEYARKYHIPVVEVVQGGDVEQEAYEGTGINVNSGFLDGLQTEEAIESMINWLESKGLGERAVNYKLRDWVFSRQRYWGEPIPLVHCSSCGIVPVPEENLPLMLPEVDSYTPSGTGESPLAKIDDWVNTSCPNCGEAAKRETNTMPQWAGSCWYYLRYLDPRNDQEFASQECIDYWMPVNLYVGGAEHAVLHLLYARFWHKVLYDLGKVNTKEPFMRLVNQGMITSYAYQRRDKSLVPHDEVEETESGAYVEKHTREPVEPVVAKMSKSLKNVINPDEIIESYGADSMRMYEMFMGPLQVSKPWSTKGLTGVYRFLDRVWRLSQREVTDGQPPQHLLKLLHKTIKKVSVDTGNLDFNTAIAQMMVYINELFKQEGLCRSLWEPFILILAPYAPHLAEELYQQLGHHSSLAYAEWPGWDEQLCREEETEVVFQVNGKVRAKVMMSADADEQAMKQSALDHEKIRKWIDGRDIVKTIAVPKKLVNIVVK